MKIAANHVTDWVECTIMKTVKDSGVLYSDRSKGVAELK
jgi:hypothetical protein